MPNRRPSARRTFRLAVPVAAVLLALAAGAGGFFAAWAATFTDQASVGGNTFTTASCFPKWWWSTSYLYRRQVTVTTGAAGVGSGYSVMTTLNHASLVGAGKSKANGDDVRVLYWNAGACSWSELHRVLETGSAWNNSSTKFWFKLQAAIGASSADGNYYLYYGNAAAASPPADATQVFFSYDNFDDGSLGAQWTVLRPPAAGWSESGGTLNIAMDPNEDFWGSTNNATLFHVAAPSADFEAQVKQAGRPTASGHTGGIFDYQNDDNYMANYHESVSGTESMEYVREASGSPTSQITSVSSNPIYIRIRKLGNSYTGWYSTNGGASFVQVGTSQTITLTGVRVGLSAFSYTANVMTMNFDDFRLRNLVNPEPTPTVGTEQPKP